MYQRIVSSPAMLPADSSWKPNGLTPQQVCLVRDHLHDVTASHVFAASKRSQDFLQLIVEYALEGEVDNLRERMIGAEMFGRPINYDTGSDSVVRVKATEVRKKLAQYYLERDGTPLVRIELPSGSYVPRFIFEPLDAKSQPGNGRVSPGGGEHPSAPEKSSNAAQPAAQVDEALSAPDRK